MIRDHERLLWVTLPAATAITAVLLAAGSLGYMCSRVEIRQHRVAREQAEDARQELAARVEALRHGPKPAAVAPAPVGDPADRERIRELEASVTVLRKDEAALNRKLERSRGELAQLKRAHRELRDDRDRTLRELELARSAAAPGGASVPPAGGAPPTVAGSPAEPATPTQSVGSDAGVPPAAPAAVDAAPGSLAGAGRAEVPAVSAEGSCGGVDRLAYRIEAAERSHLLLGERLRLRVDRGPQGLSLGIAGVTGHALDELPQHFSWSCEGTPFIVSVCRAEPEPLEVTGEVWRAGERWRDPCRGDAAFVQAE